MPDFMVELGECMAFWGERERGSVVGVFVSSHRQLKCISHAVAVRRFLPYQYPHVVRMHADV